MALGFDLILPISKLALELYGYLHQNTRLKIAWWQELGLTCPFICTERAEHIVGAK